MVRLHISYDAMTNLLRRCYGVIGPDSGFFTVSIDGSTPQQFSGENDYRLDQKLLWSNTTLGPGRHTLNLTLTNQTIWLGFFR